MGAEAINIAILDDDFGKDDTLGSTFLDLSKVQEHQQLLNKWIPLEKCKSGEVLMSAEFILLAMVNTKKEVKQLIAEEQIKGKPKEGVPQENTPELVIVQQQKEAELTVAAGPIKETVQEVDLEHKETSNKKTLQDKTRQPLIETIPVAVSTTQKTFEAGQVVITVYKARDIEKKGMLGKADPYVEITLGKQKAKSATVKNNYNPEWNFKATFDVDQNTRENINIAVFDDDFGKDDSLGTTLIDISKVQEHHQLLNQWILLEKCKSGEILLSTEFIPRAKVEEQKQIEEEVVKSEFSNQEIAKKYVQQDDVIQEDVKKQNKSETGAKGLKDMFKKEKNISSDTVQHHKEEYSLITTETVKETNLEKAEETTKHEKTTAPGLEAKPQVQVSPQQKALVEGQLVITVYKARDIEKKGMFGKADPYVKITLGKQEARSATVKNNHSPEWNFKSTFDVSQNTTEGLNIAVFDDDFGKDDSLGSIFLDLSKVMEHRQLLDQWIPLEKCKSGDVLLSAEFIPLAMVQKQKDIEPITEAVPIKETGKKVDIDTKEMAAQKKTPEPAIVKQQKEVEVIIAEETINETIQEVDLEPNEKTKEKAPEITTHEHFVEEKPVAVSPPQKPLEAGKVVITVYKATDIEQKGMFGKADPYVKITLGNQKAKSATVKNNHNPEWNFKATFDVDQNTTQNINIAVFDDDFGKDDSLGSTLLDISKVQEHHQLLNQWIPLEKCKSGAVLLSAEFIPVEKVKQQKQMEA